VGEELQADARLAATTVSTMRVVTLIETTGRRRRF
jgi:hypothetical protein